MSKRQDHLNATALNKGFEATPHWDRSVSNAVNQISLIEI
jgi:hypothetical protein